MDFMHGFQWKSGVTPMTSMQCVVFVHLLYVATIHILGTYMKMPGVRAPRWINAFAFWHNISMSWLSLLMLAGITIGGYGNGRFSSMEAFVCPREGYESGGVFEFFGYLIYLSKIAEFFDTVILVLRKKEVITLHRFHHLTTGTIVWHGMHAHLASVLPTAMLNCTVHVAMYFHFAIPTRVVRPWITSCQILQFVIALLINTNAHIQRAYGNPCSGTAAAEWHGTGLFALYLALFADFFRRQYVKRE